MEPVSFWQLCFLLRKVCNSLRGEGFEQSAMTSDPAEQPVAWKFPLGEQIRPVQLGKKVKVCFFES